MTRRKPQPNALLTTEEAAAVLGITKRALERLRAQRRGPAFTYVGRFPRYSRASLNAYLSARAVRTRQW